VVVRRSPGWRRLVWWNVALLAVLLLHDLDHVRQGRDIEAGVIAIGIFGDVVAIASLGLALAAHRVAPAAAVIVGFGTALGFVLVHALPDWGPVSQGYPDIGVDVLSWVAVFVPIAVAVGLGLSGLAASRRSTAAAAP
jgi:hypothetical protein